MYLTKKMSAAMYGCVKKKQSSLSFHWKLTCSRHDIEMKNGRVGVRQQSLTHSIWFLYYRDAINTNFIVFDWGSYQTIL
jgi:hypothetical protein